MQQENHHFREESNQQERRVVEEDTIPGVYSAIMAEIKYQVRMEQELKQRALSTRH